MFDFQPMLTIGDKDLQVVISTHISGLTISENLKWDQNTEKIVQKAMSRIPHIKKLILNRFKCEFILDVYFKVIHSVLEL